MTLCDTARLRRSPIPRNTRATSLAFHRSTSKPRRTAIPRPCSTSAGGRLPAKLGLPATGRRDRPPPGPGHLRPTDGLSPRGRPRSPAGMSTVIGSKSGSSALSQRLADGIVTRSRPMMGNLRDVGHRLRCPSGGDEQPQGDGAVEEVSHGPGRGGGLDSHADDRG